MTAGKARIARQLRERVAREAAYRCGYCKVSEKIIGYRMTIDHLVPEAVGGESIETNLWLACGACNQAKGARTHGVDPKTKRRVRLFNPRRQDWKAHFRWSEDGAEIGGLTPSGRATVEALQLNRKESVAARSLWVQAGWWPPRD